MVHVIREDNLEKHNVNKYNFKVISKGSQNEDENVSTIGEELAPRTKIQDVDSSALSSTSKESLIKSLMQKTDDMSSNFIKLQMKLEQKEEEYAVSLTKAKKEAFAEGIAKAQEDISKNASQSMELFSNSVKKLEESANEFKVSLEGINRELITAALDISKEVIKVEIGVSANEIAKVLSDELLKDLQSASKVTLKVNPNNHGAISEHVGKLEHISVVSDSAISEGGVIVLSDAGNIDSQITKRFERVRRAALSE